MRVCIAGGTGFVGTALATELTDRGHDVTVLAREPDDAALPEPVTRIAGDVTAPDTLGAALEGQDALVNLVALSPLFEPATGNDRHFAVHRDGTGNLVAAAQDHGVDRFLQVSALGADPDGSTAYIRAKGEAETIVRESGLDWTIVRPSVVFGEGGEFVSFTRLLTTPYVTGLPGGGQTRFQPIWVGDLVPMLAEMLTDDAHVEQTYELGGPEVLTLADVARLAYRAEGRSLRVLPVPMPVAKVGLTVAGWLPFVPMGPDQYRSLEFDNVVTHNDVTVFDRDPENLRSLANYFGVGDVAEHPDSPASETHTVSTALGILTATPVLVIFAFLVLTNLVPAVVDIYVSPVIRWLYVPSYVVSLFVYEGLGIENVVYAVDGLLPVDGYLLWQTGKVLTFYLVSVVLGGTFHYLRGKRTRPDSGRTDA